MAGVRWAIVTSCRRIHSAMRPGTPISSGSGMQRVAPIWNGVNMSRWRGSWARPESMVKRSSSPRPNSVCCQGVKWVSGPWRPRTPFGTPVEPEVNEM